MLDFFQSLVELTDDANGAEEPPTQAENIEALISAGTEEGLIEEEDRKLIQSVVEFGDKVVREVMTPRPNIVAISADATLEELRQLVINEQYSRIPVYEGTIDQIIGFVHVRDMFELDEDERANRTVRELMRPIRAVPETKPVNDLMREMQQDNTHMVIVVDEYGNTAGLASMEDLVEVILGEIRDEHEPDSDVQEDGQGGYIVSGSFDVARLGDLLEFHPEEDIESTTVGGLVTRMARARSATRRIRRARRHSHRCPGQRRIARGAGARAPLPAGGPMKSGFVSILGRPNAGKSTLLNQLIGAKIAIVANKPQTTRTSIQGVLTLPEAQMVFLDTPGIHKADSLLNKRMMDTVRAALDERDLLLLVVDVSRKFGVEDRHAVDLMRKANTPALLVLNKTDLLHKDKGAVLPLIEQYRALYEFAGYIPSLGALGRRPRRIAQGHYRAPSRRARLFPARPYHRPARTLPGCRADPRENPASHARRGPPLCGRIGGFLGRYSQH